MRALNTICLAFIFCVRHFECHPQVSTSYGVVVGKYISSQNGRLVSAFEGIPYAKPPLRFKDPVKPDAWVGEFEAKKTYPCKQYIHNKVDTIYISYNNQRPRFVGTEDCLYLNVYVPLEDIRGQENLNVIVGIHPGGFMNGDPNTLMGPSYLMDRDLVYVSFSYRLGVLGFLSTEDESSPGNYGLKDQVAALQYVKKNIDNFGGNPTSVTLIGIEAGAASVHYHYLSDLSKCLFDRGISISGNALNPWALAKNPLKLVQELAQALRCNGTTKWIVTCLSFYYPDRLIEKIEPYFAMESISVPIGLFGPVVEPETYTGSRFLVDHPYKLLSNLKNTAPWVASNVLNEGIPLAKAIIAAKQLDLLDKEWKTLITDIISIRETVQEIDLRFVAKKIKEAYIGKMPLNIDNVQKLLLTDRLYLTDADTAIRTHAASGISRVYYSTFGYHLKMSNSSVGQLKGVSQMDDARLIFPMPGNPEQFSEEDKNIQNQYLDFIYDFAAGNTTTFAGTKWTPVIANDTYLPILSIEANGSSSIINVEEFSMKHFWDSLLIWESKDFDLIQDEVLYAFY